MKSARLLICLALAAGVIGFAIWRSSQTGASESKLVGFQEADFPLDMPENGEPDMRFHFLSAWQANQVPTATRLDTPLGSENGALVYITRRFWERDEKRDGHQTGDDLKGIGGMNNDISNPVFAAGDGLVVYAGNPSPDWGNTVVLAHRSPEGKPIHTMYAHLLDIKTTLGSLVARGSRIGTVGTAGGRYPAHLRFEARETNGVDIGDGYATHPLNHLDPTAMVATLHNFGPEGISPAPLAFASTKPDNPWTTLQIENAEKLSELKN